MNKTIGGKKVCKYFIKYKKLTPKSVEIIRMIPVIQARVRLTNNTSAILIESGIPFVSSNHRGEGRGAKFTVNIVSDSSFGDPLRRKTPIISPAKRLKNRKTN